MLLPHFFCLVFSQSKSEFFEYNELKARINRLTYKDPVLTPKKPLIRISLALKANFKQPTVSEALSLI